MNEPKLLAKMAYHKYAAFIAHMDGVQFFRNIRSDNTEPFIEANDVFTRQCFRYRKGVVENLIKSEGVEKNCFEPFLYNPASFVTFGDTDCLTITATDSFDPTTRLTSQLTIPIRQTCLAFCPTLDSLGLDSLKLYSEPIFWELKDICEPPQKKLTSQDLEKLIGGKHTDKDIKRLVDQLTYQDIEEFIGKRADEDINKLTERLNAPRLPFFDDRPLVAVTYYKLSGLAILGPGLLLQQATYKAMATRIRETLEILFKKTDEKTGDEQYKYIMSQEDVKSFRCTLLDPQGWSDIATLMFCRNYSVVATILVALRSLTFNELYGTSGKTLTEAVECCGVHRATSDISAQIAGQKLGTETSDGLLRDNHIFCSTYTTLGVTPKEFQKSKERSGEKCCDGIVITDTSLEVDPGHFANIKKIVKDPKQYSAPLESVKPGYGWLTVGQDDFSYQRLQCDNSDEKAVRIFDLLLQIKSLNEGVKKQRLGQHILGICTTLHIPIIQKSKAGKDHMDVQSVLSKIRKSLFEQPKSQFNLGILRDSIRKIRLPAPLSHSIMYLYSDFAKYLDDPFLFERVLDMYDMFTAVYQLLTKELPKTLAKEAKKDYQCRGFLSNEDIRDTVELVELLQSALAHKTQMTFRNVEKGNPSLDVRGGDLGKVLNAVNVPLQSGLKILRKVMSGLTEVYDPHTDTKKKSFKEIDNNNKTKIGGASKISQNLRSFSQRLNIGANPDIFLASVDLNITHLTRPSALCIPLHETSHLVRDLISTQERVCPNKPANGYHCKTCYKAPNPEAVLRNSRDVMILELELERLKDMFSEMLVHRFVFEDDHETYFRNYMANYSFDPIACCKQDNDTFLRMLEVLIRGFLITDPFRVRKEAPELYSVKGNGELPDNIRKAYRRFMLAVEDAGPFFFEFQRLWHGLNETEVKQYVEKQFARVYHETYRPICCIYHDVSKIYEGICEGKGDIFGIIPPEAKGNTYLQDKVKEGLENGRPLVRILYKIKGREELLEEDSRLDSFFLITHLLREHIIALYGERAVDVTKKGVCLARKPESGSPDFNIESSDGITEWHKQLIDRNTNRLFALDPTVRGEYMRNRIVTIKTLWDISTNLRGRRMKTILELCEPRK